MIITAKFGGTSLCDARAIDRAATLLYANRARRYTVVSAPGKRNEQDIKITDLLLAAAETHHLAPVFSRFEAIARDLRVSLPLDAEFARIEGALVTEKTPDYLLSRGEYLCAKILASYVSYTFLDAAACIRFTEDGQADPAFSRAFFASLPEEDSHAVIPGFYGATEEGKIRLFPRGGSDITGALIAAATDSDLYENWTDVDGVCAADPKTVDNPLILDIISYKDLQALSGRGACVLHPDAIAPAMEAGIPICIKNIAHPYGEGTLVTDRAPASLPFFCLTAKDRVALLFVMGEKPEENADTVRSVLTEAGIAILSMTASTDEKALLIAVEEKEKQTALRLLYKALNR